MGTKSVEKTFSNLILVAEISQIALVHSCCYGNTLLMCVACLLPFCTAYPLPGGSIPTPRISVVAGRDAVLPPLISPGALILQYFIDWQDATSSATLARIQVPRSEVPAKSERYSIDPDTFELTIHSVRFEDRGSYRGVIGVRDPEGQSFTYTQTQERGVTLEVFGKLVMFISLFCLL